MIPGDKHVGGEFATLKDRQAVFEVREFFEKGVVSGRINKDRRRAAMAQQDDVSLWAERSNQFEETDARFCQGDEDVAGDSAHGIKRSGRTLRKSSAEKRSVMERARRRRSVENRAGQGGRDAG